MGYNINCVKKITKTIGNVNYWKLILACVCLNALTVVLVHFRIIYHKEFVFLIVMATINIWSKENVYLSVITHAHNTTIKDNALKLEEQRNGLHQEVNNLSTH